MIRHNPEHPYYPARRNSMQQLQQPLQGHRVVSMSQFEGPPPQHLNHLNSGQPRITFSTALSPQSHREQPIMQPPVFRDLRTRYTNSPSSLKTERLPPKQEFPQQESALVRSREEIRREQELKYDKLKTTFDTAQTVFVDKKLNVTEVAENHDSNIKHTNNRIECILEERQVLEESRAMGTQVAELKKKAEDYEGSNSQLRAELSILKAVAELEQEEKVKKEQESQVKLEQQMKGIALKSKQSEETESELERTIKELQIELRRTANEAMMARLNEYEISKKCQLLVLRNQEQGAQIERLHSLLSDREQMPLSLPSSMVKSETVTYVLN